MRSDEDLTDEELAFLEEARAAALAARPDCVHCERKVAVTNLMTVDGKPWHRGCFIDVKEG